MTPTGDPSGAGLDRVAKALALVDPQGAGLEIGPSHNPIAPKRAGYRVQIVDHLPAAALREKYRGCDVDLDAIEEVDFVWRGEPLPDLVGGRTYDWVIASHVLEHVPDLVGFLQGCDTVLRPHGVLSLVVPDKRYCFDHFRPLTTTGQVLDAHLARRTRPSPGAVFDDVANAVDRAGDIGWHAGDARPLSLHNDAGAAARAWAAARDSDTYDDVHVWTFVPESFRLILDDLRALDLVNLTIARAHPTEGFEFFASLTRARALEHPDRLGALEAVESACASTGPFVLSPFERRLVGALRRARATLGRAVQRVRTRRA